MTLHMSGIYSYYPDKDLSRACHRVLSPSFSDDDDTISTSTSLHSVDNQDYPLSEMGDFGTLYNGGTSSLSSTYTTRLQPQSLANLSASSSYSKLDNNNTISRNNSLLDLLKDYDGPGTITRLGRTGGSIHVDTGDWTQDLDLPATLKPLTERSFASTTAINQQASTATTDHLTTLSSLNNRGDDDRDPFADLQDDDNNDNGDVFTGDFSSIDSTSEKRVQFDQVTTAAATIRGGCTDLEQQQHDNGPATATASTTSHYHQQKWKEEEDDEGFDDIEIPNDIGTRSIKPHQYCQPNPLAASMTTTKYCHNSKSRTTRYMASSLPPNVQKQLSQFKETDTDDFLDGLDIKDDAFKATTTTSSSSNNSKKEKQTLESKLPRPKRHQQSKPPTTTIIGQQSPSSSSSRKKSSHHENRLDRLTAPTYASRQRGTNTAPTLSPILRTPPTTNKSRLGSPWSSSTARGTQRYGHHTNKYSSSSSNSNSSGSTTFIRTSDGSSLMAKPRTGRINYGNGSELDHLDDLADWKRPSMAKYSSKTTPSLSAGSTGTTRRPDMATTKPWRCNMSKRKLTLIKPEEQKVAKEINDMRYDEREKRWHGNEQATRPFDAPAKRRPALIKNMMTSRTAKSTTAMVVGNMTFDHQKMSWNTRHGDEEVDVLAHIDDLSENETHAPSSSSRRLEPKTTGSHPTIHQYDTAAGRTPSSCFESTDRRTSPSSRLYRNVNNSSRLPPLITTTTTTSAAATEQPTNDHHHQQRFLTTTVQPPFSGHHHHHASRDGISREFDLPIDIQRQMADQEQNHNTYFGAWPLRDECEMTETPSGYAVPQNTYILY
ncbi:unnamed protein product [Absidia cylindrospora]